MTNWWHSELVQALTQITHIDAHYLLYTMLVISSFVVINDVLRAVKRREHRAGLTTSLALELSVDGSKNRQVRTYISEIQGISGRPDALIIENGFCIPVERKAFGNKVRDRHIAQLLVYMRLIEEFEGKKPPYGYLIIGKSARRVKVYNTPERQAWLSEQINQMKDIVNEKIPAAARPQKTKCAKCKVSDACEQRFIAPVEHTSSSNQKEQLILINSK